MKIENTDKPLVEEAARQLAVAEKRADSLAAEVAALTKSRDEAEGRAAGLARELETERANRVDSDTIALRDAQIAELNVKLAAAVQARTDAEDPKRVFEAVAERVKIEKIATAVLGERAVTDSITNRELMVEIVSKVQGHAIPNDKSNDYVRARFDAATESFSAGAAALDKLREAAKVDSHRNTTDTANSIKKAADNAANAWRKPLPSTVAANKGA